MGQYLCVLMQAINRRHPEIEVIEVNTDQDHVHLLVSIAPKMAVSEAVRILKANTARPMYKRFPFLEKVYYDNDRGIWSDGYFMSTVGVNEQVIRNYIEHQGREDSGQVELELKRIPRVETRGSSLWKPECQPAIGGRPGARFGVGP